MPSKYLSTLKKGETAVIESIDHSMAATERRRLMDLGVLPGTEIRLSFKSPLGDPKAFELLGSTIALREEQTNQILIQKAATENQQAEEAYET